MSSSPPWWPSSSSLSLDEGRGFALVDVELLGREEAVRVGAEVGRDELRLAAALAEVASGEGSPGEGVRLAPVGEPSPVGSLVPAEALGRRVSADPTGVGVDEASRTRALSAAAVPPATSTAATVSAARAPDLVT